MIADTPEKINPCIKKLLIYNPQMNKKYEIIDHAPDPYHDAEAYNRKEENHEGWPGDGSGTDDLADYNQNEANDYCNE